MSRYEVWAATRAAGVNASARVLLAHYIEHSWFEREHKPVKNDAPRGVSYWSRMAISKALGMGEKTIRRGNEALSEAGYITISSRYREGDQKGSGGRTSNAVKVHLDVVLANQIDAPALASEPVAAGDDIEGASYPQPPAKMTTNPMVKMTTNPTPYRPNRPGPHGQNDHYPMVKMTTHKGSNKKLVNKKLEAGDGNEHTTTAPAVENTQQAEHVTAAAQIITGLAAEPTGHRNAGDFTRLQQSITALYGPTVAATLTPDAIPASAVTIGKALEWLKTISKTASATPASAGTRSTDTPDVQGPVPATPQEAAEATPTPTNATEPRRSEANTSTSAQHLPPQSLEPPSRHHGAPGIIPTPHKGAQPLTPGSGQTTSPEPEYAHIPGQLDVLETLAQLQPTPKAA
ncbi:hypothetical protein [Rothia nasimurium]|uniref:hypothetical protein n=1 Tax=Rothia nasimurium TaxID=85336 RepID=UPI002DD65775|nr:hypothetical protein [Rothia nasimurium]